MAGQLLEVLGETRFLPGEVCPPQLQGQQVSLRSSDGKSFELDAEAACIASRVTASLLEKGCEEELEVPVGTAALARVAEYLAYHRDNPPGDIRLGGGTLAECGASKWDGKFVSMDRVALVELTYAAGALGIPTLLLLCKAKAFSLMAGKTADQIRKDFNFLNDLPKSEDQQILRAIAASRKNKKLPFDEEEGLAPMAAIMNSVWRLADAQFGSSEAEAEEAAADSRSWRLGTWRAAVVEDWRQLADAPEEVRADRGLLLAAVAVSRGAALKYASQELRGDPHVVLTAAAAGGESLADAATHLRGDREFVTKAIALDGSALRGASEELRRDRTLVLKAAEEGHGSALQGAADALRSDEAFVLSCAERDPQALQHASESLRNDRDFALRAVAKVQGALRHLPRRLRADQEVVQAAFAHDPSSGGAAHAARRQELLVTKDISAVAQGQVMRHGRENAGLVEIEGYQHTTHKLQKSLVFSALSTFMANMGQSNYIAANQILDKMPCQQRPEIDSIAMMWGTVGGMGMRWKAFASMDFMNQVPDQLMSINDAQKVLHILTTKMDPPDWFGAQYIEQQARDVMLKQATTDTGYRPSEAALAYPSLPQRRAGPLHQQQQKQQPKEREAPLGGWPVLMKVREPAVRPGQKPTQKSDAKPVEGAIVELINLKSKSGLVGTVVQCYPEGRCRVALDGKKGSALLRPEFLQVLSVPSQ